MTKFEPVDEKLYRARFDAAIAKGRGRGVKLDRAGGIAELEALGLTRGDAIRWLDKHKS